MKGEKCWKCHADLSQRAFDECCSNCLTEFKCAKCGNHLQNIEASLCEKCDVED